MKNKIAKILLIAVILVGACTSLVYANVKEGLEGANATKSDDITNDSEDILSEVAVYSVSEYEAEIKDFEDTMDQTIASRTITRSEAETTLRDMKRELKKLKDAGDTGEYVIYKPETADEKVLSAKDAEYRGDAMVGNNSDLNDGVVVTGAIGNHTFGDYNSSAELMKDIEAYQTTKRK